MVAVADPVSMPPAPSSEQQRKALRFRIAKFGHVRFLSALIKTNNREENRRRCESHNSTNINNDHSGDDASDDNDSYESHNYDIAQARTKTISM